MIIPFLVFKKVIIKNSCFAFVFFIGLFIARMKAVSLIFKSIGQCPMDNVEHPLSGCKPVINNIGQCQCEFIGIGMGGGAFQIIGRCPILMISALKGYI